MFHTIQVFPPAWDWRRVAELWVAVYQAAVGCVIWWHPASLGHSSYTVMVDVMPRECWALALWTVVLGHVVAIWFNGRTEKTPFLRFAACALHMSVLMALLVCFLLVSDFYRATTTIAFSFIVLGAASIAAEDVARARNRRAP